MAASASPEISRGRKLLAGASMLGTAGLVAHEGLSSFRYDWPLFMLFAAILGASAVGITRRSLVAQVLSRGTAWIVLLPAMLTSLVFLADGRPPPFEVAALGAGPGAALLLARPLLHTRDAREQFGPKAFRRWLLAGSTATAATGFIAGVIALASMPWSGVTMAGIGFAALAASMLASAIAVVRMRSWGIFLGALTSAVLLASGLFVGHKEAIILSLGAAPALLMHVLPVLVARSRSAEPASKVRVTDDLAAEPHADARYRVPAEDAEDLDVGAEPPKTERAAIRA